MTVTQPVGTFQATLTSIHLIRRRESKGWGLMLRGRTKDLDREVSQWRNLSRNPDDPYDVTGASLQSFQRFAAQMGLAASLSPAEIVSELQGLVGGDVLVRVHSTPAGPRTIFSRSNAW